jgi:hypothetical protein
MPRCARGWDGPAVHASEVAANRQRRQVPGDGTDCGSGRNRHHRQRSRGIFFAVHDNLRWHGVVLVMGQVNGSRPIGLRNDFPKIET